MTRYDELMPWQPVTVPTTAIPPGATLQRDQPARPAGVVADVVVPMLQAGITGGLLAGVVVIALGAVADLDGGDLFRLWAALALAVCSAVWLALLQDTRRLLWAAERLTGRDLDGDRAVGKPEERLIVVNADKGDQAAQEAEHAERRSAFVRFVMALPARGTEARTWEPDLGRARYQEYRDVLIRLGWARWLSLDGAGKPNKRKGWALTVPVDTILDRISG